MTFGSSLPKCCYRSNVERAPVDLRQILNFDLGRGAKHNGQQTLIAPVQKRPPQAEVSVRPYRRQNLTLQPISATTVYSISLVGKQ